MITKKEQAEIDQLRKQFGLPPIKSGKRHCLKCDKKFKSQDLTREKCCENCRRVR